MLPKELTRTFLKEVSKKFQKPFPRNSQSNFQINCRPSFFLRNCLTNFQNSSGATCKKGGTTIVSLSFSRLSLPSVCMQTYSVIKCVETALSVIGKWLLWMNGNPPKRNRTSRTMVVVLFQMLVTSPDVSYLKQKLVKFVMEFKKKKLPKKS